MTDKRNLGFNSMAVHAGYHAEKGPVNPPVERSSTYVFDSCEEGAERFGSAKKEGIYSRLHNSNCDALERKIAALEGGYGSVTTGSGMAAVETAYYAFLDPTSHVVATTSLYGSSRSLIEKDEYYKKWGIRATFLDTSDVDKVREAVKLPNTRLLYIETPANPTLAITDIEQMAEVAKEAGIPLVVDNTFCSPYLQNPIKHGADVSLHSMTKSIGGHANAIGGVLVTRDEETYFKLKNVVAIRGGILSPDSADLFFNGLKTLGLRMERMQQNAIVVAEYLSNHPKVAWVTYPGLENHPQYELVRSGRQMRGPGCMMVFGVKGGYDKAKVLLNTLDLVTLAVSLGGVESLVQHPASMTHTGVARENRLQAGITDDLVRMSIGIEDIDDLIADLEQAFAKVA